MVNFGQRYFKFGSMASVEFFLFKTDRDDHIGVLFRKKLNTAGIFQNRV